MYVFSTWETLSTSTILNVIIMLFPKISDNGLVYAAKVFYKHELETVIYKNLQYYQ